MERGREGRGGEGRGGEGHNHIEKALAHSVLTTGFSAPVWDALKPDGL